MTVRTAAAVEDLSGGRLTLGVGAGWQEREHANYGWDLLSLPERFDRFEEGVEIIKHLLHSDKPINYLGQYYRLQDAILLPRPQRPGGPPILVGGNGPKRTLPLVAQYANEWNGVYITATKFAELNARLDTLLAENGRRPEEVRRSLMTNVIFGRDQAELERQLDGRSAESLRAEGRMVGTPAEVVEQLNQLADVGVQRVMLQWLQQDDLDGLEALAKAVLPPFRK